MRDDRTFGRKDVRTHTTWYKYPPLSNQPPQTASYYVDALSLRTYRSDSVSTPQVNGKWVLPTAYRGVRLVTSPRGGFAKFSRGAVGHKVEWTGASVAFDYMIGLKSNLTPNVPTYIVSAARAAARDALRNTNINVGTTVGEMRETMRGLASILKDILKLVKSLRPEALLFRNHTIAYVRWLLKGKQLASGSRRAAKEYLRVMYGIRPLLNDAGAYLNSSKNILDSAVFTVQKRRSTLYPNPSPTTDIWYEGQVEVGCEVGYTCMLTNPTTFDLWRFGLTNPASVAWELTTLSFVLDWFTGIGAFVDAIQQPLGIVVLHGYETQFAEGTVTKYERIWNPGTYYGTTLEDELTPSVNLHIFSFLRSGLVAFIPPIPYIRLGDINGSQVTTLVALLTAR